MKKINDTTFICKKRKILKNVYLNALTKIKIIMRILKKIFFFLLALVGIALIVALFVKKDYSVIREVNINKPKQQVFDYLRLLKNQDNFSKWASMDPAMQKSYRGVDGTVGFVSAWKSDKKDVGSGEQEIKKITEGERLDYELRFKEPWESTSNAYLATNAVDSSKTNVAWGFEGKMPYPMNLMCLFMDMDGMIGKDLATGLNNLKVLMEKQ